MWSRKELKGCQRLVVKLGTNVLAEGESLARKRMAHIVGQLAQLHSGGCQVLVVSSGAIALGKRELKLDKKARGIPFKQVLASVGQAGLMQFYRELFRGHGIKVAQALLARSDMTSRLGYLNARNTLLALLELGVVPVVNENDVVAVEELYSHYAHPRTAILMGHARGVILQKCAEAGIEIKSFSATRIKKSLTGNGRASKEQVQRTIKTLLALIKLPEPSDVADAIGAALCCGNSLRRLGTGAAQR